MKTLLNVLQSENVSCAKVRPGQPTAAPAALITARTHCQVISVAVVMLMLAALAPAQTLTGTVKNSTTGKVAAGDEIVLFKLGQGMQEAARTNTDAEGRFTFKLDEAQIPHLIRAIHQGVTYHRVAPPGTTVVAIAVYDAAEKVNGIGVVADILRVQTSHGQIVVIRDFGVRNTSNPPCTQTNDRNLEFYIPEGAQIIDNSGTAITENGAPLKSAPLPEAEKNRYSFNFPLRPGLTRFEVSYQIPYSGSANLDPRSIYPLENFMVMVPKTMRFKAASGSAGFKAIQFPNAPDATVQIASKIAAGQKLAFNLSGEGMLAAARQRAAQGAGQREKAGNAAASSANPNTRPGGGLGAPIDAPDPLQKYRWWILGGCAGILIFAAIWIAWRQQSRQRASLRSIGSVSLMPSRQAVEASVLTAGRAYGTAGAGSMLMDGIKEQFFQIEIERKQGQISQAEYLEAKAGLEETLARALEREAQRA